MENSAAETLFYGDENFSGEINDYVSVDIYQGVKRLFDVSFVLLAAPFLIFLIGGCALLVKCDGGAAFYSQPRLGKDGVIYRLWKLRTMVPNAEKLLKRHLEMSPAADAEWRMMQKLRNDPRITKVGRYLRKYSLDELPQLFNVLIGDMSIVGPRPMMPEQQHLYPGVAYFDLRPGLTGLWQISERNGCAFLDRALYDTRYSAKISLAFDLQILWRTLFVVFKGTGV